MYSLSLSACKYRDRPSAPLGKLGISPRKRESLCRLHAIFSLTDPDVYTQAGGGKRAWIDHFYAAWWNSHLVANSWHETALTCMVVGNRGAETVLGWLVT